MSEQLRFNLGESKQRRDEGIELVTANNRKWSDEAYDYIKYEIPIGWVGQPEDWRREITLSSIGPPRSDKAWGGLTVRLLDKRRPLIAKTGRRVRMKDVNSHARMTDEYVRI